MTTPPRTQAERNADNALDVNRLRARNAELEAAVARVRAQCVDRLRFLAGARAEYLHEPEPQDRSEIEAMSADGLVLWVESKTAGQLADYLDDPSSAWGWLPTWRWDEWLALDQPAALATPEPVETLHGRDDETGGKS